MDHDALAAAFASADHYLQQAIQTMEDVDNIGVWVSSDDSSDNRNRRKQLMEASWSVAHASGALRDLQTARPAALDQLQTDLNELSNRIEQLSKSVPDTMRDRDLQFTSALYAEQRSAEAIVERIKQLANTVA